MEELKFDYSLGFNYETMEKILTSNAKEQNISIDKHIKDTMESYFNFSSIMLENIAKCKDAVEIVFLIDKYNRARSAWTHYDIFESERKIK